MPVRHVPGPQDGDVGTEQITVVAAVADAAVEAPAGLPHGRMGRYLQIDLVEGRMALLDEEPGLDDPGFVLEIVGVDLFIGHDMGVPFPARTVEIYLQGEGRTAADQTGSEAIPHGPGAVPEEDIKGQGGLLPRGDGLGDILVGGGEIASVNHRRAPVVERGRSG